MTSGHRHFAAFGIDPKIDVVELVLRSLLAKIGAGEEFSVRLQTPDRLMDIDEIKRNVLPGFVIFQHQHAIMCGRFGGDIAIDTPT